MPYEAEQACFSKYKNEIEDLASVVTIVSCIVSSVSFLFKCFDVQSFKFPGRLATMATFLSVLFSFTLLVGTITNYRQIHSNNDRFYADLCVVQAVFFQFITIALTLHWTFIGYVTYLVVVKRYSVRRFKKLERNLSLVCWVITFVLTFGPVAVSGLNVYGPNSGLTTCYLQRNNDQFYWFFIQMVINLLVGTYFTIRIATRLISLARSEDFYDNRETLTSKWCSVFKACCSSDGTTTSQSVYQNKEEEEDNIDNGGGEAELGYDTEYDVNKDVEQTHDLTVPLYYNVVNNNNEYQDSTSSIGSRTLSKGGSIGTSSKFIRSKNNRQSRNSTTSINSPKKVIATVMRYHLLRHVIFMVLFLFIFVVTFLDSINQKISAEKTKDAQDPDETLKHRFPKDHPCGTSFAVVFTTCALGLAVGLTFLKKPVLNTKLGNNKNSIDEMGAISE